ncbi:MAG: BamA/TamA family outer membrane protein [Myxococcales bacterium]|nr:BamA/TamA family outer membrane protein [Myxococcales bacterium]
MSATQTIGSASLVVLLLGSSVPARAEPDDPEPVQRAGEVREQDAARAEGATQAPGEVAPQPDPPPPPPAPSPAKRPPTGRFEIGAGYSTDDQFIAQAQVAQDSLFGSGHRLALTARVSAREQLFRLGYDARNLDGNGLTLRTELYSKRDQLPGFARTAVGGGATLVQPVGANTQAFFGYRVEEVATTLDAATVARGDVSTPISPRDGRIAALRAGVVYSTLDQPFLPTSGTLIGASFEMADPRWGSEIRMTRFDGWGSVHRPFGPFTVHLGGSVSTVDSRDPGGVPLSERLHLDGSSVVRGFAPGSIGPHDPRTGLSLGGNLEYTARGELELPLIRRLGISAVGFVDHAGIYDAGGAGSSGTSVGVGLIWRSPIGPLRFDWAIPLGGDGKPHFGFGFGTSF